MSEFEKAYAQAVKDKKRKFTFNGKEYNTSTEENPYEDASGYHGGYTTPTNFQEAFKAAKDSGKSIFIFKGKEYTTQSEGEPEPDRVSARFKDTQGREMTDFQKAYKIADEAGKTTFMFKGKKYKTSNKKSGKAPSSVKYNMPSGPKYKSGGYKRRGGIR